LTNALAYSTKVQLRKKFYVRGRAVKKRKRNKQNLKKSFSSSSILFISEFNLSHKGLSYIFFSSFPSVFFVLKFYFFHSVTDAPNIFARVEHNKVQMSD
jgi:hypothetical protein